MSVSQIPEAVSGFNIYRKGERAVGIGGEVTLPSLEAVTTEVSGPGILGSYEAPIPGQFGGMELTIPFRVLYGSLFDYYTVGEDAEATLRGAQQVTDGTGTITQVGMRVVVRGACTKLEQGKVKIGEPMDPSITIQIKYLLIEIDGESKVELDKLNGVFKVNGKDKLAEIKRLC